MDVRAKGGCEGRNFQEKHRTCQGLASAAVESKRKYLRWTGQWRLSGKKKNFLETPKSEAKKCDFAAEFAQKWPFDLSNRYSNLTTHRTNHLDDSLPRGRI